MLQTQGLVEGVHGLGVFVTETVPAAKAGKQFDADWAKGRSF